MKGAKDDSIVAITDHGKTVALMTTEKTFRKYKKRSRKRVKVIMGGGIIKCPKCGQLMGITEKCPQCGHVLPRQP
jgi:rubrerythrin